MNIVFMGTPEFAVPCLHALSDLHRVSAVFCQPDRPKGRSRQLRACPVKQAAIARGLAVYQPERIRAKKWVALLRGLAPDLIVVAAFGQILPQSILDLPRLECLNVHASLLPRWRGASPIHFSILEGDAGSGVSIMRMVKALDAGPVYAVREIALGPEQDREGLERTLACMGAELLTATLPHLAEHEPQPQDETAVTYAPIITKAFGHVDFDAFSAHRIERMTRAFQGWPGVYCAYKGTPMKIVRARVAEESHRGAPGRVWQVGKNRLAVSCAENTVLDILEIQPSGKKALPVAAFINGYRPQIGDVFLTLGQE